MRKIDFEYLLPELAEFEEEYALLHGLHEENSDELDANIAVIREELGQVGLWSAYYRLTGAPKQLIDDFVEWLLEDHFLFDWDDHEIECNATDYGLSITRTEDFNDQDWADLLEHLRQTIPADWREVDVNDLYIAVPKVYGLQQANQAAIERLQKAGFNRMAELLRDPLSNIELTTEDIIAGHIVGVLLTGVTPQSAAEFQSETFSAGLLPVWTNPTERKSQDEVLAIYADVLRRLTDQ